MNGPDQFSTYPPTSKVCNTIFLAWGYKCTIIAALSKEERLQRDIEQMGSKRRKTAEEQAEKERKELAKALNADGK